jgi:hypothetical protein
MEKTKHTPGPWEIGALLGDPDGKSYEYPTIYRRNEDGSTTYVADIMGALSPPAWPNARLIASAPGLLEACKNALELIVNIQSREEGPMSMPWIEEQELEAAIARAEGKE